MLLLNQNCKEDDGCTILSELDKATDHCSWNFITCENKRIIAINLKMESLSNAIPYLFLSHLKNLYLENSILSGAIPLLGGIKNLKVLHLSKNNLTGSIPVLSGNTNLVDIDLGNNLLTGTIPSLSGLDNLVELELGTNLLTGTIPSVSDNIKLNIVDLGGNSLTGNIPLLSNLDYLRLLNLNSNSFTGAVPLLTGLPQLSSLDLSGNQLIGVIPSLALDKLRYLHLGGNSIDYVPNLVSLSPNLIDLDLLGNDENKILYLNEDMCNLDGTNNFNLNVPAAELISCIGDYVFSYVVSSADVVGSAIDGNGNCPSGSVPITDINECQTAYDDLLSQGLLSTLTLTSGLPNDVSSTLGSLLPEGCMRIDQLLGANSLWWSGGSPTVGDIIPSTLLSLTSDVYPICKQLPV